MLRTQRAATTPAAVRLYLCGRVTLECGNHAIRDGELGSAQSRLLLAFLGTRRTRPAARGEIIDALWGADPPPSVDTSLNAVVSKLRAVVRSAGAAAPFGVATESCALPAGLQRPVDRHRNSKDVHRLGGRRAASR